MYRILKKERYLVFISKDTKPILYLVHHYLIRKMMGILRKLETEINHSHISVLLESCRTWLTAFVPSIACLSNFSIY